MKIDLLVGGDLGEIEPASLVGKRVRVESATGYVFIGNEVSLVDTTE